MSRPCDDADKTILLVNTALAGVPAAYAASGSVAVTAIAAAIAALLVVATSIAGR